MAKLHAGKFAPKHRGPKWHALWIGEAYNPRVVAQARTASGAYAIRDKATHEVLYVGESSRGTIWKTLLRHVQAPQSFRAVRETGVLEGHPSKYEVALHITSRGHRPRESSKRKKTLSKRGVAHRTDADQRAMFAQARWIASLKPSRNKDDGNSEAETEAYRAHVARQEAEERDRGAFSSLLNPGRASQPRAPREVLKAIEAGPSHSLAVKKIPEIERPEIVALVARGFVRKLPKRGRWPERYVVTSAGSYELGTFESADDSFRSDAREAGALERERRAKSSRAAKPAGEETKGKHRGQLRMFNPAPKGALVELGKLTRLEPKGGRVLRWSLREAPALSYDDDGRLFIVYTGKIVRSSTPAELREYSRSHWGKKGLGVVRSGGVAPGPFVRIGAAQSVTYTTQKGGDSELVDYVHPFGEGASLKGFLPPQIVEHCCKGGCGPRCAANGAIALQGGTYRVTSRGIVG